MHLDAQEIELRVFCRLLHQCLPVAETDLQHDRCPAAEQLIEAQGYVAELHAEDRPEFVERSLLGGSQAARTAHETADRSAGGRRVGIRWHCNAF